MKHEPFALSLSKEGFRQAQPEGEFIHYRAGSIDTFIAMTMTAILITYCLFAISTKSQFRDGEQLIYTAPLVIFGMLRYTYQEHRGK